MFALPGRLHPTSAPFELALQLYYPYAAAVKEFREKYRRNLKKTFGGISSLIFISCKSFSNAITASGDADDSSVT